MNRLTLLAACAAGATGSQPRGGTEVVEVVHFADDRTLDDPAAIAPDR